MLLWPVVQIALDTATRGVGRGDEPSARGDELRAGFGLGDRAGQQFHEPVHAFLGVVGQRFRAEVQRVHRPPEAIAADDRADHHPADPLLLEPVGEPVVEGLGRHLDRPVAPPHRRRSGVVPDRPSPAERNLGGR